MLMIRDDQHCLASTYTMKNLASAAKNLNKLKNHAENFKLHAEDPLKKSYKWYFETDHERKNRPEGPTLVSKRLEYALPENRLLDDKTAGEYGAGIGMLGVGAGVGAVATEAAEAGLLNAPFGGAFAEGAEMAEIEAAKYGSEGGIYVARSQPKVAKRFNNEVKYLNDDYALTHTKYNNHLTDKARFVEGKLRNPWI